MIATFDSYYTKEGQASCAAVLFSNYADEKPAVTYSQFIGKVEKYISGAFYKRELPGILLLLKQIREKLDEIIVDGYVMLGDRPGLGQHLYTALDEKIPVIGVAKSEFKSALAAKVFRGKSRRPLYVTSAGIDLFQAAEKIQSMYGIYRIPSMLKRADILARNMHK